MASPSAYLVGTIVLLAEFEGSPWLPVNISEQTLHSTARPADSKKKVLQSPTYSNMSSEQVSSISIFDWSMVLHDMYLDFERRNKPVKEAI